MNQYYPWLNWLTTVIATLLQDSFFAPRLGAAARDCLQRGVRAGHIIVAATHVAQWHCYGGTTWRELEVRSI